MSRFGKHWPTVALKAFYNLHHTIFWPVYLYAFLCTNNSSCSPYRAFVGWTGASADVTAKRNPISFLPSSQHLRPWGVLHRASWCFYFIDKSTACRWVYFLGCIFILFNKEFCFTVLGLSTVIRLVQTVLIVLQLLFLTYFKASLIFQVSRV